MSITIKTVSSKRDFKIFARFSNKLYKGNKYYVPSMPLDDLATFDKNKNAAFEFCEAEYYLAYKNGCPVRLRPDAAELRLKELTGVSIGG